MKNKLVAVLMLAMLLASFMPIIFVKASGSGVLGGIWYLDEGTGTSAYDSSGNGNHGTVYGGATWVNGKVDKALEFGGVDDYVEVPDSNSLDITGKITMEAWIYPYDVTKMQVIVQKYNYSGPPYNGAYYLGVGGYGYNNKILFGLSHNGYNFYYILSKTNITANIWTHVAATSNGTHMSIYINGIKDKVAAYPPGVIYASAAPLRIGCFLPELGVSRFFNGVIDEVRVAAGTIWTVDDDRVQCPNADFTSIQAAINAASNDDTILVHDGTYNEALYINKRLTIRGASTPIIQGSGSFTTNYGAREAVIFVENAYVVLESLDIEGQGLGPGKNYGIIYEESNGTIRNCIVSPNTINDMSGNAIGAWDGSNLTVELSMIKNFGRIGVFYYDDCSGGVYNSVVEGQVYSNQGYVNYGIEIETYEYPCNIEIIGNEIYNCDNTHPSPSWSSAGIVIDGWLGLYYIPSSTVIMRHNRIHNSYYGIEVVANPSSYAHYNNIYDNREYGVIQDPDYNDNNVTFDARFNWWGDASGPTHSSNLGGSGDVISDYVDYSPWLGFVVGTSPMTWHVNPTGAPGAIQEAINKASPEDTIIVHEGTYYENLVVQKALNIRGVDKETTIIQAQPVGYGDRAVEVQTSDVTISGFTISGYAATETKSGSTYWGVYAYGSSSSRYSNIVVTNCIFTFLSQSGIQLGYVDGSLIADNIFKRETRLVWYDPPGPTPGSYIEVTRGGAGPALWYCTGVTIDPNVIQTTGVGIFLYSSSDILIEANTISAPDTVNPSDIGIHLQSCTNIDIIGNTILNFTAGPKSGYTYGTTGAGINILASKAINVSLNNLRNNTLGVLVQRLDLTTEPREIDIHYNNLEHNTAFGVLNCYTWVGKDKTYTPTNASYIVDARYNWWGHETGPYHATSWTYMGMPYGPNYGLGNNVSDYVLYYLWLPVVHDVAVIDVVPSPTTVVAGETVTIDVTAKNEGNDYESFTVTVYYDDTPIASQNVVNLPPKWSTTLTFHWDTTGMPRGNYTIKAEASVVPEETDVEDNTLMDGVVEVLWHDVAVIDVVPSRDWVYQGHTVSINVTVLNEGDFAETVTVTLYYNITANKIIGTQIINLLPGESQTIVFTWDTKGVEYCHNYTLTAVASIAFPDNDPADNTFTDGKVKVRILGDVNGDGIVDIADIYAVALGFGETPDRPRWDPELDINNDGIIDIEDIYIVAINFGKICSP